MTLAVQFWLDLLVLHVRDLGQLVAGLQSAAAQPCEFAVAGQQVALASQQLVCHTGLDLIVRSVADLLPDKSAEANLWLALQPGVGQQLMAAVAVEQPESHQHTHPDPQVSAASCACTYLSIKYSKQNVKPKEEASQLVNLQDPSATGKAFDEAFEWLTQGFTSPLHNSNSNISNIHSKFLF